LGCTQDPLLPACSAPSHLCCLVQAVSEEQAARTEKAKTFLHDAFEWLTEAEGLRIKRFGVEQDPAAAIAQMAAPQVAQHSSSTPWHRKVMGKRPTEKHGELLERQTQAEEFAALDEAIKRLARATELFLTGSNEQIRCMAMQGLALYYRRQFPEALQRLEAVTGLVMELYEQEKEYCCVPTMERCSCWYYKGLVLRALDGPEEALEALRQAAEWEPDAPRPAKVTVQPLQPIPPGEAEARSPPQARAAILFELGKYDEGFQSVARGVETDGEWSPPWVSLITLQGGSERLILEEKVFAMET